MNVFRRYLQLWLLYNSYLKYTRCVAGVAKTYGNRLYSLHCNIPSTGTSSTRLIQQSCKLTGQIIKDDVGETHAISSTMVHHGFSLPPVLVSKLGKQTGLRRVYLKKTRHEEEQNMDRWTEESLERLNR